MVLNSVALNVRALNAGGGLGIAEVEPEPESGSGATHFRVSRSAFQSITVARSRMTEVSVYPEGP